LRKTGLERQGGIGSCTGIGSDVGPDGAPPASALDVLRSRRRDANLSRVRVSIP
jgi:hypothetical protein